MLTPQTLDNVFISLASLWALLWLWFLIDSIQEKVPRAAWISAGVGAVGTGILILATYLAINIQIAIFYMFLGFAVLTFLLFILPVGRRAQESAAPTKRFDERMIMFARARLQPGTPNYEEYYALHPEQKARDDRTRARPGLLSPNSKLANPGAFAAADASFQITEALHSLVEGQPGRRQHPLTPEEATEYIKAQARLFGAHRVGITELKPYHIYSHIGRGPGEYGNLIDLDHAYAIAFTVEMDHSLMQSAPHAATVMESAHQYVESGQIAVQLASAIRNLGYQARAHIDGNYRVICPLVARDAGLGEIGRITLLMTPQLGPRVRLGVVTTSLNLVPDEPRLDPAMIDFCTQCKKCAHNCPSNAIPFSPRTDEDGVLRWKLNAESCFAYWNEIGTDCGICMAVCPYAHPDTPLHNLIRWGNARSGLFRRAAIALDDVFYGKKPGRKQNPDWLITDSEV